MMTNHRMEGLSRAYLQAVAAQAGVNVSFQLFDYGVDFSVRRVAYLDGGYADAGEVIDLQLRSTTRAIIKSEQIGYDLSISTHEWLRTATINRPRILVLLVMPETEGEWLAQTEDQLCMRRCAYWHSLHGAERVANAKSTRVWLPRANVFDVPGLVSLLDRCRKGEVV